MFHSIIAILTTAAVASHALLGCCAHHAHSCDQHRSEPAVVAHVDPDDHCCHGHHHHDEESDSLSEDLANGCGHEHERGDYHECDEGDCIFTSVERSNDVELMLTFSMWCQTLGNAADADAFDNLRSLHSAAQTPPDPLSLSGSARAETQVWRL